MAADARKDKEPEKSGPGEADELDLMESHQRLDPTEGAGQPSPERVEARKPRRIVGREEEERMEHIKKLSLEEATSSVPRIPPVPYNPVSAGEPGPSGSSGETEEARRKTEASAKRQHDRIWNNPADDEELRAAEELIRQRRAREVAEALRPQSEKESTKALAWPWKEWEKE